MKLQRSPQHGMVERQTKRMQRLALQAQRDLWNARQSAKARKRIKRMTAPEPAAA